MRVFLAFLFFSLCVFALPVMAEDADALPDVPVQTQERGENFFANASDAQIKESQRFYKYCQENPAFQETKNCKCAATKYLEMRVKLGEVATPDQILAETRSMCLLNGVKAEQLGSSASRFSNLTDKQLEEVQDVYAFCTKDPGYKVSHDCRCFASKFLDKRLELGPVIEKVYIFSMLKNECRNVVETTGVEYSTCMTSPSFSDTGGVQRKKYCECYARQWAKNFKNFQGNLSANSQMHLKASARGQCKRPAAYQ